AEAHHRGAATLTLEVAVDNAAARRLYESTGFTQVGRRKRYYADGSDALVLQVAL
ncbi:MAG TPA: ribosomal-protein-alanine acetyltransferase, partial [Acetobacteraceae bacterium]|nr:ribosomal-protein-alanine acetyltransferase [Acetobacteraceae bacterium]